MKKKWYLCKNRKMRTIINIDVDSERTPQINISKPSEMLPSDDGSDLKETVMNDIVALTEVLCLLSKTAIDNGFMPKESLVRNLNNRINELLTAE